MRHIVWSFTTLLCLIILPAMSRAEEAYPVNRLAVRIDPERHALHGVSEIVLPASRAWTIDLSGLTVSSVTINGAAFVPEKGTKVLSINAGGQPNTIRIVYDAVFPEQRSSGEMHAEATARTMLGPSGVFLAGGWYPIVEGREQFHLTAVVPRGFEAISEAELITVAERGEQREFVFEFPLPLHDITLVAGPYTVAKETADGVDIFAYFFTADAGLAQEYLSHVKGYLDRYRKLLGPFPFRRFSVVENILPTGVSLPTFTLLGQDVVRLPFIVETSLGHEVLHQWFGAAVYPPAQGGNWTEGLTTYLADHRYEEEKGKGWEYRKQMLIALQSAVQEDNDFPLSSFGGGSDRATRAIGYGRAAMVFHQLRELIGDEPFKTALSRLVERYRFKPASWSDIEAVASETAGRDLGGFFKQWVAEKGSPELTVQRLMVSYRGARILVSFDIVQKGRVVRMRVPVVVRYTSGETRKVFEIEKETTSLEIEAADTPLELVLDDGYDCLRRLAPAEYPPVIARLLGDRSKTIVVPAGSEQDYATLLANSGKVGYAVKKESEVTYDDLRRSSLVVAADTRLAMRYFGRTALPQAAWSVTVRESPFGGSQVVALVPASSEQQLVQYLRRLAHYGKYSRLTFDGEKNVTKTIDESSRGLRLRASTPVLGVEIPGMVRLDDVIGRLRTKDIIYVGEVHDRFEHHRVQFEVIRALHRAGRNVAIGMEMFQRPFQQALDDYISGRTDERQFLKKSEYFKRWGFDYNLYREILLYAREYRIPVVALNAKKELVTKVSQEGMQALTKDELEALPQDLDLTDDVYRERLRAFFERHGNSAEKNFDFFYQAQVVWDETMAHAIDAYLKEHADRQMIVIAGVGHLAFGSGIPKRAHRLNHKEYGLILNTDDVERDIADAVFFPEPLRFNAAPLLMVQLKEENKRVRITAFTPHSVSEKAGLKEDDVILALDGKAVEGVEDIKIQLFDRKKGDTVAVTVLRRRFLFGDREVVVNVTL